MNEILEPHDRPVPASYRVAAVTASLVVVLCFVTERWVPWFVEQMAFVTGPWIGMFAGGLLLLLGVLFAAPMVCAVWLAFRWPAFALAIALLPALVAWMDGNEGKRLPFGIFAVLGGVALTASWRRPFWSVISTAAAIGIAWAWLSSGMWMAAPFNADIEIEHGRAWTTGLGYTVVLLLVLGAGLVLRRSALREEERRALAARAGEVEQQSAVVEERARLARDLHDVVAHHVSLIAVRAETAPYTHTDLSTGARTVLGDIAADARLALDELRGVLGILGRSGEDAERAPQPSWGDLPALVERTRAAGLAVTLEGDVAADVGASTGYAAYRVVQEALTNARKHAPGVPVAVRLASTGRLVTVTVRNSFGETSAGGSGRGLAGMRERVEALGGRLTAGPVGDEYVVEATLPVGPA